MNYQDANRKARVGLTWGEARAIMAAVDRESLTGMARVNKGLTKQHVYDILSYNCGEPDDYLGTELKTVPIHIARNILREFS